MRKHSSKQARPSAAYQLPHSWSASRWPTTVWPNDPKRARWVIRANRDDLIASGALARGGKGLIVLGRGYARWLEQRAAFVADFESNNPAMRAPDAGSDAT